MHAMTRLLNPRRERLTAEAFLLCAQCGHTLRQPQTLECQHTFCRQCCFQQQEVDHTDPGEIQCPACGILSPSHRIHSGYPCQLPARRLLRHVRLSRGEEPRCTQCQGGAGAAVHVCHTCQAYVCDNCMTKKHVGHNLASMPKPYVLCCTAHKRNLSRGCTDCEEAILKSLPGEHSSSLQAYIKDKQQKLKVDCEAVETAARGQRQLEQQLEALIQQQQRRYEQTQQEIDSSLEEAMKTLRFQAAALRDQLHKQHQQHMEAVRKAQQATALARDASIQLARTLRQVTLHGQEFTLLCNYEPLHIRSHRIQAVGPPTCATEEVLHAPAFQAHHTLSLGQIYDAPLSLPPVEPDDANSLQPMLTRMQDTHTVPSPCMVNEYRDQDSVQEPAHGLAFLPDGSLAVAYRSLQCIKVFKPNGCSVATIQAAKFNPNAVDYYGNDQIVAADGCEMQLKIFDLPKRPSTREQVPRVLAPKFHAPVGLAVSQPDNLIGVADAVREHVVLLTLSGQRLGQVAQGLRGVECLAFDHHSRLWVTDTSKNCLRAYSTQGVELCSVGGLSQPAGVAVDAWGHLVVANGASHQVCLFTAEGKRLRVLLSSPGHPVQWPHRVAVSATGLVAVTRREDGRIMAYKCFDPS